MLTGSYRRCVRPEAAGTHLGDSSLALGGGSDREHLSGEVTSSLGPEGSGEFSQPVRVYPRDEVNQSGLRSLKPKSKAIGHKD